jgi:hypothetical protein
VVQEIAVSVVVLLRAFFVSYDLSLVVFGSEYFGLCYTCVWVLILKLVFTLPNLNLNVNDQTELN